MVEATLSIKPTTGPTIVTVHRSTVLVAVPGLAQNRTTTRVTAGCWRGLWHDINALFVMFARRERVLDLSLVLLRELSVHRGIATHTTQATQMKTINAQVTDTNHRARGEMSINVDFDQTGPILVKHEGRNYYTTQKVGTNRTNGLAVREMATLGDARLWITLDGAQVWED